MTTGCLKNVTSILYFSFFPFLFFHLFYSLLSTELHPNEKDNLLYFTNKSSWNILSSLFPPIRPTVRWQVEVANYQHYQNYNIDDNTRNLIIVLEGLVMHGLGLCLLLWLGLEGLSMRDDQLAGPGLRLLLGLGLHLLHLLAA